MVITSLRFIMATTRMRFSVNKILIIDDDVELTELFQDYLSTEKFSVDKIHNGIDGLIAIEHGHYDLVILDMMLPDMNGNEVLKRIRDKNDIPVLMFTAKGDDIDRIIGLELGADDYVPKPCTPRELVARIRAILRRVIKPSTNATLNIGPLQLSSETRKASWFEQDLNLTSTEFNLLETLASHAGQVVTKHTLSEQALGRKLARYDRSIDVHMSSIRQKLGKQNDGHDYIQTVRGKGYQLIKEQ